MKLLLLLSLLAQTLTAATLTTLNAVTANIGTLTYPTPPFNPNSVGGMFMWMETDTIPDAAGTAMASWTNRVAATNDFVQGSSGLRPVVTNSAGLCGNYPWLFFKGGTAGSGTFYTNTMPFSVSNNTARTIILAARMYDTANYNTMVSDWAVDSGYFHMFYHSGGWVLRDMVGGVQFTATAAASFQVHTIVITTGSNASKYYTNGVLCAQGTLNNTWWGSPIINCDKSGTSQQNSGPFECAAYLCYTNTLSAIDRGNIETWLKNKYGL
jgi:hypothetical protein